MARDAFRLAFRASMSADDSDTGELMLYGEIVQDYSRFYKEMYPNDKSASDFDKAIKELKTKGAKKLNLRINSPGGIVTEAVAMRGILAGAGFERINIRIEGMCASAATLIASIPGANVAITPGSEYMIHNPWSLAWGNANEMEKVVEHLRQLESTSRGFYALKSHQAEDQIKKWMDDETWFSAEDAVKYGFADEVTSEGTGEALPAAACVTSREMATMRGLYKAVPDGIVVREEEIAPQETNVSNAAPVAGDAAEINHEEDKTGMDIKDINVDQLRAENPALLEEIQRAAIAADAQRREDIDAITPPMADYQAMAEEAKKNGTSVLEFQKSLIAAMKKKGADHMEARKKETAPAQKVPGDAADDQDDTLENQIKQNAKDVAEYAKAYHSNAGGKMF